MSEENKQLEHTEDQVKVKVRKRLMPDQEENRALRRINTRLTILLCVFALTSMALAGVLLMFMNRKQVVSETYINDTKYNEALKIMSEEWFFADEIENVKGRLQDQALIGMVTNEEDPHTYYMTQKEGEEFVQSINRNFVGIGVQFIGLEDGQHLVRSVFKDSPAENAGVQPGDYIYSVNGTIVKGLSTDNVADLVRGEENTPVHMEFMRGDEILAFDIVRKPIVATAYGSIYEDVGLLEILQFGQTTGAEAQRYLNSFKDAGVTKLVIDLRGNGGGYLYALQDVAGLFLDKGAIAIVEEDAKGNQEALEVKGDKIWNGKIVAIVDGETASAAEAFVLAMREQYPDFTVIGTQTYGKGTVQITYPFSDGSSLKYTTDKWLSKNGVWVNGEGIAPDEVVEVHPAIDLMKLHYVMEEGQTFTVDQVSPVIANAQEILDYLRYEVDRKDGYFSPSTEVALKQFQEAYDLEVTGILDETTFHSLFSAMVRDWVTVKEHDNQIQYARELLNG